MAGDVKAQKLLKHLAKLKNKSGAVKPSPQTLLKLKESLEKVPFSLLTKGMSGVVNSNSMVKGVLKLANQLGGLNNVGEFKNILNQAQSTTSGGKMTEEDALKIAALVPQEKIEEALGGAMALGISLMDGLDPEDQKEIDREAGTA